MGDNYIQIKIDTHKEKLTLPKITLYPLVCMHIGAAQCDMKFLKEHIRRIKNDPYARWVYMGDGGECVTKNSKGAIYAQLMSPQDQLDMCVDLLIPIKEKGLLAIRGNHGHRIYKDSGLSFDNALATRLGLPYLGVGVHANLVVNRSSYDLYFHHGKDSGTSLKGKITAAGNFGKFIDADAIFRADSDVV